jgi:NDP-sugar pyrophosphorylase family protein
MNEKTLVVLAAGMGSRYGGLKQIDPVGPGGESLLDYSIHDARAAGFGRVVFVIRRDIEQEFREKIGARYSGRMPVDYVFQETDDLPGSFVCPHNRNKPWGTAHAVWCSRHTVATPFAVINADDFYGAPAYRQAADFLDHAAPAASPATFALVGYRLDKTLSDHGTVARGICEVDSAGLLQKVEEMTQIGRRHDGSIACGDRVLDGAAPVSMNLWGFTPDVFPLFEESLGRFLQTNLGHEKAEHYIPSAVAETIVAGRATVQVLPTDSDWFGVTYREDKPRVVESIARLVSRGDYPARL